MILNAVYKNVYNKCRNEGAKIWIPCLLQPNFRLQLRKQRSLNKMAANQTESIGLVSNAGLDRHFSKLGAFSFKKKPCSPSTFTLFSLV